MPGSATRGEAQTGCSVGNPLVLAAMATGAAAYMHLRQRSPLDGAKMKAPEHKSAQVLVLQYTRFGDV